MPTNLHSFPRAILTFTLLLPACSSSSSPSNGTAPPNGSTTPLQFSEPCATGTCAAGLTCARAGLATGLCTTTCTQDSDCSTPFGSNAFCGEGQCVAECSPLVSATCAAGAVCDLSISMCTQPLPAQVWSCTVSGGVCSCTAGGVSSGVESCPSNFHDEAGTACCYFGGPQLDPSTWNSRVCQLSSSIPAGGTCYDLPISLGDTYGNDVASCPGGMRIAL